MAAMRFRVDAILFDIDGTLVDSTAAVIRTWTTWAAKHGIDADEILRVCHGRRTEDTLGMFLPADRWAAVTSGSRELMRARLTAAGLPIPEVLVSAEAVEAGKPEPEGYLKAAAALGRDIRRCLVVEDAPAGIHAGRAAGAQVLAVTTSHPASDLTSADAVIPDLTACDLELAPDGVIVSTTV